MRWTMPLGAKVRATRLLDVEGAGVPAGLGGVVALLWNQDDGSRRYLVRWDNGVQQWGTLFDLVGSGVVLDRE